MSLPLEGVRILDLTAVISGPLCTYQLAMLGADVIKVEVPGSGDIARPLGGDAELNKKQMGVSFWALNAGKKSITLNLKSEKGREVFKKLLREMDAVVENYRPGTMKKMGLGYEELKKINPRIIYCAMSGFGQEGPWARRASYDQIIQGLEQPQIKSRQLIKTFENVKGLDRNVAVPRLGFQLASGLPDTDLPPPQLGQDTQKVLGEFGYTKEDVAELRRLGAV